MLLQCMVAIYDLSHSLLDMTNVFIDPSSMYKWKNPPPPSFLSLSEMKGGCRDVTS